MAERTIADQQKQKRNFWKRQIEQWGRSGSSQAEYCREQKLSAKSFPYWKSRFRQKSAVSFVPVEVKPEAQMTDNSTGLVLCKDGYRIEIKEGFKAEALGKVLRTLREL